MKLNHINLLVTNVAEAVHFFGAYFDLTCKEIKGDNIVAILTNKDDFILTIMVAKDEIKYPAAFHIGFMQKNKEEVNAVYAKLIAGGIYIASAPGKIRDSFGFYFTFDKLMIEVGYYISE